MSDLKYDIPKMLREWADGDLGPLYQGNRGASLGYIAAKALDEAAARIRELEAERDEWRRTAGAVQDTANVLAARLARAEGLLREADPHIYGNDSEQWLLRREAYFDDKEPRT